MQAIDAMDTRNNTTAKYDFPKKPKTMRNEEHGSTSTSAPSPQSSKYLSFLIFVILEVPIGDIQEL